MPVPLRSSIFHRVLPTILIFFFNDTATTEIYTLSLHDALPIFNLEFGYEGTVPLDTTRLKRIGVRSEEHTSELQSHVNLVCRLLLEKKKKRIYSYHTMSIADNNDVDARRANHH